MTLTHYPISNSLFTEFDRLFNRDIAPAANGECCKETPEANENGWKLRIELPGFKKDEVSLSVEDENLLIEASTEDESRDFLGNIERRIRISDEVDAEKISAKLEDGLLYLEIPKKVKAEPLPIVIN